MRCWNLSLPTVTVQCTRVDGKNTCGREFHDVLAFGSSPTGPAAAYPAPLCQFISDLLVDGVAAISSAAEARSTAGMVTEGRVKRHTLRGTTEDGARVLKRAEDEASQAGMRNPATVCNNWPSLVAALRPVQAILLGYQRGHPEFQGLASACGPNPTRAPPSIAAVAALRLIGIDMDVTCIA